MFALHATGDGKGGIGFSIKRSFCSLLFVRVPIENSTSGHPPEVGTRFVPTPALFQLT